MPNSLHKLIETFKNKKLKFFTKQGESLTVSDSRMEIYKAIAALESSIVFSVPEFDKSLIIFYYLKLFLSGIVCSVICCMQ